MGGFSLFLSGFGPLWPFLSIRATTTPFFFHRFMPFQRNDPCPIEQSKRVHEVRKAKNNQAMALELRALGATFPREELIPSQDVVSFDVVIVSQVEAVETKFPASSALNTGSNQKLHQNWKLPLLPQNRRCPTH